MPESVVFLMRIDLRKFFSGDGVVQNIDYSFELRDVEIDGAKPFISPIEVHGTLKSFEGSAELKAELTYDFSMPCNRCMEETLTKCRLSVFHTLVRSIHEDDNESYIQVEDEAVDLDELLYSDIILELPAKYICKEDCKGICPHCGKNLNKESCNCGKNQIDPRFEVLKKLIDPSNEDAFN